MKPAMYVMGTMYYFFDDEEKLKEFLAIAPPTANHPYPAKLNCVPKTKGWKLSVHGHRGDSAAFQDPKNTTTMAPNFDTLEEALAYLEDNYKAFIEDEGLKAMFEKKTFIKRKGYADFNGTLIPVWE